MSLRRKRGQPALPGRRIVVKLEERHIERARTLGAGKITRGIRKALERTAKP